MDLDLLQFKRIEARQHLFGETFDQVVVYVRSGATINWCTFNGCAFVAENEGVRRDLLAMFRGKLPEKNVIVGDMVTSIKVLAQHKPRVGFKFIKREE